MGSALGARLGVDVGTARVGVAVSDPHCILATPLETVPADPARVRDVARVLALVEEHSAVEVVIGLPLHMSGKESPSAVASRAWAAALQDALEAAGRTDVSISLVDERLTTVVATRALHSSGRKTKTHRAVIDQAAATELLQSHIERLRSQQ